MAGAGAGGPGQLWGLDGETCEANRCSGMPYWKACQQ